MLKKLIRESFFNPALHFLPLFVFLVVEENSGTGRAWVYSLPVLILVGGYINHFYHSVLKWYLAGSGFFFMVALTATLLKQQFPASIIQPLYTEIILMVVLLVLYMLKGKMLRWVSSFTNKSLSMINNVSEMVRYSVIIIVSTAIYVHLYFMISMKTFDQKEESLQFLQQLYHAVLLLLGVYQTIRVFAVRHKLMQEEWWPIVNSTGSQIGSIHYQNSLWIEPQKYMHPVARLVVLEGTRILLHQNTYESSNKVQQWDSALGAHIKYGESPEDAVRRAAVDFYGSDDVKPVFLTNYIIENSCEFQYVHLFVTGKMAIERINPAHTLRLKWWTLGQICEELESGIFTENFCKEFELLMRTGLIDEGSCTCDCSLRDAILPGKTLA
ncbi:MAG: NUDIX hydrolase [Paludibacter sp.]|nr:NUDIX hydrolase [Paludibacter sp.]